MMRLIVFLLCLFSSAVLAVKPIPVAGTINIDPSSVLLFEGHVSFQTTVTGKQHKLSRVYITVVCAQSDLVVYQWSADPDFTFPLIDQGGQGLEWHGGPVECVGVLVYRVKHGRDTVIDFLDQVEFAVDG
jgi:hypothetical protein